MFMPQVVQKAQPTSRDVHINRPLTSMSVGYIQDQNDFVADRMFPRVPCMKQSDLYFVYDRGDFYRAIATRRAPGTESAGSGYNLATQQYFAHVYAVHKDVDDQGRANADQPLAPDEDATVFTTQQCLLRREIEWMTNYFTPGVWTNQSTPATLWSAGGSTPIEDIRAQIINIKSRTGYMPNKICMGPRVWSVLQDHPDFVSRVNAGQTSGPAIVNRAALAAILEIDEVMVAWGVENSAIEGATDSFDFIAGNHLLLCYAAPAPSRWQPSAGYTFTWTGYLGAGAFGNRMSRFRMEQLKSDRIECEMAFDTSIVANDMAHFFNAPIA